MAGPERNPTPARSARPIQTRDAPQNALDVGDQATRQQSQPEDETARRRDRARMLRDRNRSRRMRRAG